MEEIYLIKGDSSDIYEFMSKEIPTLDASWTGSWAISNKLGQAAIQVGALSKNQTIYEADQVTVKTPADSFFIFQISPTSSELLEAGKYILAVEINQTVDTVVVFRKEVMQNKLIITEQGVL